MFDHGDTVLLHLWLWSCVYVHEDCNDSSWIGHWSDHDTTLSSIVGGSMRLKTAACASFLLIISYREVKKSATTVTWSQSHGHGHMVDSLLSNQSPRWFAFSLTIIIMVFSWAQCNLIPGSDADRPPASSHCPLPAPSSSSNRPRLQL